MADAIIPNSYRMTELGPLPVEWEVVRLGDYCHVYSGYAFKSGDFCNEGVLVVKIGNLQNGSIVLDNRSSFSPSEKVDNYLQKFVLGEGDILIALTGATTGKIAIVPEKFNGALLNQRVGKFDIFDNALHRLFSKFYFSTNDFQESIKTSILQSAQGNISPKQIEDFLVPLPPLPEQQKIASILSTVQNAKEKTEAVINAAKDLKKSMMKHLFTYGPVSPQEAENVPLKETEIGMVPEKWEVVRLRDKVVKTEQKDMRKTSLKFKYIDVSSIDNNRIQIISSTEYQGKDAPSRARKVIKEGDVIIATVRPTLKRIAITPKEYDNQICSTAFCVLRGNKDLFSYYLYYVIQRDSFIDELEKIQRGASYPAVTDSDVKNIKLPLPPLPAQQKIASILSAIDQKIEAEESVKKAIEDLFKTLLHDLMIAKIRVNNLKVGL